MSIKTSDFLNINIIILMKKIAEQWNLKNIYCCCLRKRTMIGETVFAGRVWLLKRDSVFDVCTLAGTMRTAHPMSDMGPSLQFFLLVNY